jgi:hypothetical protein
MGLRGKALLLALAALLGGCGAKVPSPSVETRAEMPIATVDQDQLMADLWALSDDAMEGRLTGSDGAALARDHIARRFGEIGLAVEQAEFDFTPGDGGERRGANLWTRIEGTETPDRWIVVSAHYDHLGIKDGEIHNGADDNASGVAVLIALAAELRRTPPVHSVLLVAFDAEEPVPGFFGARAFVERPPVPIERILLNVNLDMVSRQDGGALWAAGTGPHPALRQVLDPVAAQAPVPLRFGHDGHGSDGDDWTELSDHAVFHWLGIPFLYFGVEDHADYHGPGDVADRIDADFFARSARTILAAVRRLDEAPAALIEARRAAWRRSCRKA